MKSEKLKIYIEQNGALIDAELRTESDTERCCQLLDAREYLRRAWHALDGLPCEDNDTTIETQRAMQAR